MNDLTTKANENFFELMIIKYPHLNELKLQNNILTYSDYNIDLKNFRLINFNKNPLAFSLSAYDFLNLVKIHIDIEDELNYIKKENYNENAIYMQIDAIIVKEILTDEDRKTLNDFIKSYKMLLAYQDYLLGDGTNKLNNMNIFINSLLQNPYLKNTEGLNLLINIHNEDSRNSKGPKLVLNNAKYPSVSKDEDDSFLPKIGTSGYASIMLLLYIILNIGFILAVIFIK